MTTEEFNTLVGNISQVRGINHEELLDKLADYLNTNFRTETAETRRADLDSIRETLITTFYEMPNHTLVSKRPDYRKIFGFDDYEMTLLEEAANELEIEGFLEGNANYTKLTPSGVVYARQFQ